MSDPTHAPPSDPAAPATRVVLDWSGRDGAPLATVGEPAPCVHCGRPALLRHPDTGRPCHKTCEEARLTGRGANPAAVSTLDGAA